MKKIKFLSMFFLLGVIFIFASCEKKEITTETDITTNEKSFLFPENKNSYNATLDKLAKIIAKGMENREFRVLLKKSALEKIDGDYDIIYDFMKNRKLANKFR